MTDRIYQSFLGLAILLALYFESAIALYALIIMLLLEGVTGFTLSRLVGMAGAMAGVQTLAYHAEPDNPHFRFNFKAALMWRLVMAVMLMTGYFFYQYLWFFPWFMGFAIFGAGLSGVCPILMAIRWMGFK